MNIYIRLGKNAGTEESTGKQIASATLMAECLKEKLESRFPDAEVDCESTYDLTNLVVVENLDDEERSDIERAVHDEKQDCYQEFLEIYEDK